MALSKARKNSLNHATSRASRSLPRQQPHLITSTRWMRRKSSKERATLRVDFTAPAVTFQAFDAVGVVCWPDGS
jgi:hypothetical protein